MYSDGAGSQTSGTAHDSMVTVRLSEPSTPVEEADVQRSTSIAASVELLSAFGSEEQYAKRKSLESTSADRRLSAATLSSSEVDRNLHDEHGQHGSETDGHELSDEDEVNWEKLEKTEDEQSKEEEADNVRRHLR